MQKFISVLVTFVNGFLIFGFLYHTQGLDGGNIEDFLTEEPSFPLIALTFLIPIYLFTLGLVIVYLRFAPGTHPAFPRFWVEELEAPQLARFWEALSAAATLGVPLVGFIYCWFRLHDLDVWEKESNCLVGLWNGKALDPACNLDIEPVYRFGRHDTAANGVDIWPGLQPSICLAMSSLALLLMLLILALWMRRSRR